VQTRSYISYAQLSYLPTFEGEINIDLTHQVIHVNQQMHLITFSEKTKHQEFTHWIQRH